MKKTIPYNFQRARRHETGNTLRQSVRYWEFYALHMYLLNLSEQTVEFDVTSIVHGTMQNCCVSDDFHIVETFFTLAKWKIFGCLCSWMNSTSIDYLKITMISTHLKYLPLIFLRRNIFSRIYFCLLLRILEYFLQVWSLSKLFDNLRSSTREKEELWIAFYR